MSKPYNGHPSWNAWNVSLWINNDQGLYSMARDYCRGVTRREAAKAMVQALEDSGIIKTPDGARYTVTNVQRAMRGM